MPSPRVLVIGLDARRVPGPWDPAPIVEAIAASTQRMTADGIAVENCLFGLDGSDDIEAVVAAALDRGPWDCVVVGGGVRHNEELVELFEALVNLVHRRAPDAEIAFNHRPEDVPEAVHRRLGKRRTQR